MSEVQEKVNILLVDDQPAKLISYEVMLNELNENLVKVLSAREAFAYLLRNEVAVVLVDVCMPELDGFELAAMIREHPRFERTAIIFVSAIHMADDDRLRGYRMGAVDYMPVPVIPDILRAKVKVFAELYRKTRELEKLNSELEMRVDERTAELAALNASLLDSESRRSMALAAGRMGSWNWDLEADCFRWDDEHFRILELDPAKFVISAESLAVLVHPDDWKKLQERLAQARAGQNAFEIEVRVKRPSGDLRWFVINAAASFDGAGRLTRISGVTTDITERKNAEERHTLLAREVDHRAKNALALVQSILRLTKANSAGEYIQAVEGRIAALSHAHTLLSESRWQGAELRTLIGDELAAYGQSDIVVLQGAAVTLPPAIAQSVALVLHELATNSAKYGALSAERGKLDVRWIIKSDRLNLSWHESNGPKVEPPKAQGFGMKVIRATVESQLRGDVEFLWKEHGLTCTFSIPISPISAKAMSAPFAATAKTINSTSDGRIVLLVEDETIVGLMMRDMLDEMGVHAIGPCASVSEAMSAARANDLAAAVLDVNLHGEMVYELADYLTSKNVPFVFVTGYGRENVESRFRDVPLLRKPVDQENLGALLRGYLHDGKNQAHA